MGPPLVSGGRLVEVKSRGEDISPLQWGRRWLAAEGRTTLEAVLTKEFASMGPPLVSGGRRVGIDWRQVRRLASMGPPLVSGGRCTPSHRRHHVWSASMGPPLVSGGRTEKRRSKSPRKEVLQWGRRWLAAEGRASAASPRGVHRRLQWGRRWLAAEGFPWGRRHGWRHGASMGPPLVSGGRCVR